MLSQELNLSLCSLSYYYTQRNSLWLDWNLRFHEACISSKNMLHTDKRSKNIYIYACNLFLAALKTLENLEESTSEEVILVWSSWYEQSAFNFTKRTTLQLNTLMQLLLTKIYFNDIFMITEQSGICIFDNTLYSCGERLTEIKENLISDTKSILNLFRWNSNPGKLQFMILGDKYHHKHTLT